MSNAAGADGSCLIDLLNLRPKNGDAFPSSGVCEPVREPFPNDIIQGLSPGARLPKLFDLCGEMDAFSPGSSRRELMVQSSSSSGLSSSLQPPVPSKSRSKPADGVRAASDESMTSSSWIGVMVPTDPALARLLDRW